MKLRILHCFILTCMCFCEMHFQKTAADGKSYEDNQGGIRTPAYLGHFYLGPLGRLALEKRRYSRKAKYNVCHRPYTKYELVLTRKLVRARKRGLRRYLRRHQKCKNRGRNVNPAQITFGNVNPAQITFGNLPHGTTYHLRYCEPKGRKSVNNTLSMCHMCVYTITLSPKYLPRYHTYVTCHRNGDYSCLQGGGNCVMNTASTPVLYDAHEKGLKYIDYWWTIHLPITKSCSCQIIKGDLMEMFL
ncbi:uncharacterized protein LOC130645806 [Hydractinia symbiolongicarpus]|uniref:uncharacterized protein LOC130645806 n=1 Tax=Hydractinia symbiolongicarpus TaxID=13093 RepID=UPI002550B639|nr:uncharacterized protein LOC130645806 [Hydractinia symbiolongicarpus]